MAISARIQSSVDWALAKCAVTVPMGFARYFSSMLLVAAPVVFSGASVGAEAAYTNFALMLVICTWWAWKRSTVSVGRVPTTSCSTGSSVPAATTMETTVPVKQTSIKFQYVIRVLGAVVS